jgi:hypothetical protein
MRYPALREKKQGVSFLKKEEAEEIKMGNLLKARCNFVTRCSMICTLRQILLLFGNLMKEKKTGRSPGW